MKKQVVIIHGGDCFDTYEDYMSFLKEFQPESIEYFKKKGWKDSLQDDLGDNFEVIKPKMPNAINAKYLEWKIWFEKLIPFLEDDLILVGHSLGGIFLVKYLSENKFSKKIEKTFIISAPFNEEHLIDESLADFILPEDLTNLEEQGGKIHFYHSKDDPIVPFADFEKYKKKLPKANFITMEDKEHFCQETFPELIEEIKK
ncbi:alpha/beta hydrolase [Patescibacteria group bacterium]|nr:alpha/beta hydrolase [Patescibacteria group bacterium]